MTAAERDGFLGSTGSATSGTCSLSALATGHQVMQVTSDPSPLGNEAWHANGVREPQNFGDGLLQTLRTAEDFLPSEIKNHFWLIANFTYQTVPSSNPM